MSEVPLYLDSPVWRARALYLSEVDGCVLGYLAHKKLATPQDQYRALGIGLLQGPRRRQFLMSEVPLYCYSTPSMST